MSPVRYRRAPDDRRTVGHELLCRQLRPVEVPVSDTDPADRAPPARQSARVRRRGRARTSGVGDRAANGDRRHPIRRGGASWTISSSRLDRRRSQTDAPVATSRAAISGERASPPHRIRIPSAPCHPASTSIATSSAWPAQSWLLHRLLAPGASRGPRSPPGSRSLASLR